MAILFGLFIHFLAVIASVISPTPWVFGSLALAYIMSWIVFSIVGYLIKIVPFLWWTHRYSQKVGKENTPALKDMMDEKIIQPILIVFPVAFAGIALSFIIQNRLAFLTSQAIFTAATIVFCFLIMRILKK